MKKWMGILVDGCKNNNLNEKEVKAIIHSMLRDFMISKSELRQLYEIFEFEWDEEFMSLGRDKHINDIRHRYIDFDNYNPESGSFTYNLEMRFNKKYYSYLVKRAMTSKAYTKELIYYVNEIKDKSFTYYSLDDIRIRKLLELYPSIDSSGEIEEYIDDRKNVKIGTIYDLWKDAYIQYNSSGGHCNSESMLDYIYKILIEVFNLQVDQDNGNKVAIFVNKMEELLLPFDKKIANSIKLNFLILHKYYLDDDEYDINKGKLRSMIMSLYKSLDQDMIEELFDFYKEHFDILQDFCSGYVGLANVIFKEVITNE